MGGRGQGVGAAAVNFHHGQGQGQGRGRQGRGRQGRPSHQQVSVSQPIYRGSTQTDKLLEVLGLCHIWTRPAQASVSAAFTSTSTSQEQRGNGMYTEDRCGTNVGVGLGLGAGPIKKLRREAYSDPNEITFDDEEGGDQEEAALFQQHTHANDVAAGDRSSMDGKPACSDPNEIEFSDDEGGGETAASRAVGNRFLQGPRFTCFHHFSLCDMNN